MSTSGPKWLCDNCGKMVPGHEGVWRGETLYCSSECAKSWGKEEFKQRLMYEFEYGEPPEMISGLTTKDIIDVLVHYNIIKTLFPSNEVESDDEKKEIGYCSHDKSVIYIDQNLSISEKRYVLIHEITHALLQMQGKKDDEGTVSEMARKTYDTLYENRVKTT